MPKKINFTKEQEKEIIRMYEEEYRNPDVIGEYFGCSHKRIFRVLKENNINTYIGHRLSLVRGNKKWVPQDEEEDIIKDYNENLITVEKLCKKYHHKTSNIKKVLIKHKIVIRSNVELRKINLDSKYIKSLYDGGKSVKEIAKMIGCSWSVINISLKKSGTKFRKTYERSEKVRKIMSDCAKERYKNGWIPSNKIKLDESKIIKWYHEDVSTYEIADRLRCSIGPIYRILKEKKVQIKPMGYFNKGRPGWNNNRTHLEDKRILWGQKINTFNNWSSFEPYGTDFNKQIKNKIRNRDNQVCMNCGIHREKVKYALSVHHINYNKQCNIEQNFITLCHSCHASTNFNKEYWANLFQEKLSKLYSYKYSPSGEIIINLNNQEVKNEK